MDCQDYTTEFAERKKGEPLRMEDRGAIKALNREGLGVRAIARRLGCAPSTVSDELKRGTPPRKSSKGRAPGYSPKHGEAVQKELSPAPQGWFLQEVHRLGGQAGSGTQKVAGCLRRSC